MHKKENSSVKRFSCFDGDTDICEGLVLHEKVIDEALENELIAFIQKQCARGRSGELRPPTYLRASGVRSQGNQREAIMYGGFFDFNRARPGKASLVPPFPPLLVKLVDVIMAKGLLPLRPDSCIINQYAPGDCIPPHTDHESYPRPICTLSLLGEEPMLVGSRFRTVKSCTWKPILGVSVPLPPRSLLVLGGNSGNIAKHCISACAVPRISVTLRKNPPPDWKPKVSELVGRGKVEKAAEKKASGSTKAEARLAAKLAKKQAKQARRNARRLAKKGIAIDPPLSHAGDPSKDVAAQTTAASAPVAPAKNCHGHTFSSNFLDHFETPRNAYADIAPLLRALGASSHKIYDPFYCKGTMKRYLASLGFPNVINRNEDFWDILRRRAFPPHDIIVTNPPYSDEDKFRTVEFAVRSKTPAFVLLPSYCGNKSWLKRACGENFDRVFVVRPDGDYQYTHIEDKGHKASPFHSSWFVFNLDFTWASSKSPLVCPISGLAQVGVKFEKRLNPRQRKKRKLNKNVQ